jgi:hypothetical protein
MSPEERREYVRREVDKAPPLSRETVAALQLIFASGGTKRAKDKDEAA